jgi:hypothetical protein
VRWARLTTVVLVAAGGILVTRGIVSRVMSMAGRNTHGGSTTRRRHS